MMQSSGLTPDQVRARLRAQGIPSRCSISTSPAAVPIQTIAPSDDVFAAVRALGIGDTTARRLVVALRTNQSPRSRARRLAFMDTLQRALKNDTTAAAIRALLTIARVQRRQLDSGFKCSVSTCSVNERVNGHRSTRIRPAAPTRTIVSVRATSSCSFLTGDVEKSYTLTVTREGSSSSRTSGTVNVAGLTRTQLEDALYSRLGRVYSGVRRGAGATTRFYIDVSQMGTNQVFVNGDVEHPDSYRVSRAGTVMTALYLAGGPTASGSMRNVSR